MKYIAPQSVEFQFEPETFLALSLQENGEANPDIDVLSNKRGFSELEDFDETTYWSEK